MKNMDNSNEETMPDYIKEAQDAYYRRNPECGPVIDDSDTTIEETIKQYEEARK